MKQFIAIFIGLTFTGHLFAQKPHEFVTLKEHKNGKRITLSAVNTDTIAYSVFLMVKTDEFRRSSSKPMIKTIAPNSTLALITMIKLSGKEGKYDPVFIVNSAVNTLEIRKDYDSFEQKIDNELHNKQIIIFIKNECNLCNEVQKTLRENRIVYKKINIDNLKKKPVILNGYPDAKFPILQINGSMFATFTTLKEHVEALRSIETE